MSEGLTESTTAFRKQLKSARDFQTFKRCITRELQRLGFSDWCYFRLDVPLPISKPIGTLTQECWEYDFIYQHLRNSRSCIYRSEIAEFLKQSPVEMTALLQNKELMPLVNTLGYHDFIGIPLHAGEQDNHAVFTLAAKGVNSNIRPLFSSCEDNVHIIIKTIEETGNKRYPGHFIGIKNHFERLKSGRPLRLLETMARNDYGIEQAAKTLEMTRAAADKQLARIREYLGANTTHGALIEAIKLGLIKHKGRSD